MEDILRQLVIAAVPILVAITFHEVAHGYAAYRMGDGTAKAMGRLTLNPLAHIDLFGTILMPVALMVLTRGQFVFGYAKPVPINPFNFRHPRKGLAISSLMGPVTNLALALFCVLFASWALIPLSDFVPASVVRPLALMMQKGIWINVALAAFNLLPIPPLDGGRVLAGMLPARHAMALERIEPYGFMIVMILIATGVTSFFIVPVMRLFVAVLGIFSGGRLLL